MKKILPLLAFFFLLITAFRDAPEMSSIYGSIEPAEAVKKVMAISGTDTIVVVPQRGKFAVAVNPGIWRLYIESIPPYRDILTEYFKVYEGISTDAGVITLTRPGIK